jgi:hypothetical protein
MMLYGQNFIPNSHFSSIGGVNNNLGSDLSLSKTPIDESSSNINQKQMSNGHYYYTYGNNN